nr:hypothetical protein [Clostridium paraputrificum]
MGTKKDLITLEDLSFNENIEDDIFLEVSGAGEVNDRAAYTTGWYCTTTNLGSIAVSLTSLTSASDPANTYTELGCC